VEKEGIVDGEGEGGEVEELEGEEEGVGEYGYIMDDEGNLFSCLGSCPTSLAPLPSWFPTTVRRGSGDRDQPLRSMPSTCSSSTSDNVSCSAREAASVISLGHHNSEAALLQPTPPSPATPPSSATPLSPATPLLSNPSIHQQPPLLSNPSITSKPPLLSNPSITSNPPLLSNHSITTATPRSSATPL